MKALRAEPLSIGKIFRGYEFIIPEFQRPYSWGIEESTQLWADISLFLNDLIEDESKLKEQYFLGSIVVHPHNESEKVWEVIDGQQRLTTLMFLVRLLFGHQSTHTVLEKMLYKTNPDTEETTAEPRLDSRVLVGGGRNDYEDLKKIFSSEADQLEKRSLYKLNYTALSKYFDEWWNSKALKERDLASTHFRENIVLLPIICDSRDDALKLFQIINNRGLNLNDSDIFKAAIYHKVEKNKKEEFIDRWSHLDKHEDLFTIHMHVLRAKAGETGRAPELRRYTEKYLEDLGTVGNTWDSVITNVEDYHSVREQETTCTGNLVYEEQICLAILSQYPNIHWQYPRHVFLDKYGARNGGLFMLADDKQEEYIELLKNSIRYFYIRGIVHNTVDSVREITYKVGVAISRGKNYLEEYRENVKADKEYFDQKLSGNDFGRYQRGLVWLCASLNSAQKRADYAQVIGSCQVEHVLPHRWGGGYGADWTDDLHAEYIEKIGNKIPLEWKINIRAGANFFERKQERYKDSKVQDAFDLASDETLWKPSDVDRWQKKSLNRFRDFFAEIFSD